MRHSPTLLAPLPAMKQLLVLGLLTVLAIGCNANAPSTPTAASNAPTSTVSETSPDAFPANKTQVYTDAEFGFQFTYPENYVINPNGREFLPVNDDLRTVVELWRSSDYEAIQTESEVPTELPPNIRIEVLQATADVPLSAWKVELSHDDDRPITVDGQEAIAYTSTGLYEQDNVLVQTPNGQQVIRFSVSYLDAADPMRQVFQSVVSSFRF